jgi:hypothetical protein
MLDGQPAFNGTIKGSIYLVLAANRFRVELRDGQLVDAVVPDDRIDQLRQYYIGGPITDRIGVLVELRQPPATHQIVRIFGQDGFVGEARTPRR